MSQAQPGLQTGSTLMSATALTELVTALAVVGAALVGFNALVGKGPRGTVWIVAACVLTWASMLPFALRDPDGLPFSHRVELIFAVLQLCGIVGVVIGVLDALVRRANTERHAIAEWIVRQPLLWGIVFVVNFFALLFQGAFHSPL